MMNKFRLSVVCSHPIQYFAPFYRTLATDPAIDLTVFFASYIGQRRELDKEFGVPVAWSADLLSGYRHVFLPNAENIRHTGFLTVDNPRTGHALRASRPDAVLIHGYSSLTNLRALIWCRAHGVPALMISDSSTDVATGGIRHAAKKILLPLLLGQFSAMLTMSDRSEAHLARFGYPRERMFRCPPMIGEGYWRARADRARARSAMRKAWNVTEDTTVILAVTKLYRGKRVHEIVDALAMARFPDRGRDVVFVIAGDGEDRPDLERRAASAGIETRFLGFVNQDVLPNVYAGADLLVHAAELEQYGMVLLEASVVGLPLVVSDKVGGVGPTSIARPDTNASIFRCGDVEALASAISSLVLDQDHRASRSAGALKVTCDHTGAMSVAAVKAAVDLARKTPSRRSRA